MPNFKYNHGLLLMTCLLSLGACSAPPKEPDVDSWIQLLTKHEDKFVKAARHYDLNGVGQVTLTLTCDYRTSQDNVSHGFWLKLDAEISGKDQVGLPLGLDPSLMGKRRSHLS